MTTITVSLTDDPKGFVDERVRGGAYGSTDEYVRDLIRRDRDRHTLHNLVLDGLASRDAGELDDAYLDGLRASAHRFIADTT